MGGDGNGSPLLEREYHKTKQISAVVCVMVLTIERGPDPFGCSPMVGNMEKHCSLFMEGVTVLEESAEQGQVSWRSMLLDKCHRYTLIGGAAQVAA